MDFYIPKGIPPTINLRIDRPGKAPVIIAGLKWVEKSQLKELVAKINENFGTNVTEADIEKQIEERIKHIYRKKPSFRQMMRDGKALRRIQEIKL